MKNQHLFFLILSISLFACGPRQDKGKSVAQIDPATQRAITDSIYQHYLEKQVNDFPTKAVYERYKVYPVDAAALDTSFLIYRGQLLDIVQQKDVIQLLPMIDPNIKVDFGGGGGIADFVKMWKLEDKDQTSDSALWPLLENILSNGGLFSNGGRTFSAPYTYANFPNNEDAFSSVVVSGGGVRMRATSSLGSKIMTNLSHDVVELLDQDGPDQTIQGETYPWIYVKTKKGEDGFVWGKFITSPLDFRALFDKSTTGNWKLSALVAGD